MTNKPMLSVERELLEDMLNPCADFATHERLRALLDKPVQPNVADLLLASAHSYVKVAGETQNLARHLQSRIEVYFDGDPDAQHKDDPVACVIAFREGVKEPEILSWNQLPVGEHRLYAEQPAPVAVVMPDFERWWSDTGEQLTKHEVGLKDLMQCAYEAKP